MHGNIWEWCLDSWDSDDYGLGAVADPISPNPGSYRVMRGGSWGFNARLCRSANRDYSVPATATANDADDVGFRVALP